MRFFSMLTRSLAQPGACKSKGSARSNVAARVFQHDQRLPVFIDFLHRQSEREIAHWQSSAADLSEREDIADYSSGEPGPVRGRVIDVLNPAPYGARLAETKGPP